jgi:signal transduction histidine kinase
MTIKGLLARRPSWTVRLRLTLLYGSVVLVSTGAVVGSTYLLFDHWWSGGGGVKAGTVQHVYRVPGTAGKAAKGPPATARKSALGLDKKSRIQAADLRQLLTVSGIAMGAMVTLSAGVGWFVAGRVLRPIRTITTSVREISEDNLHARLAATGPDDELRELSDTFDRLLERLEAAFEAQRQFAANASHELRTPLTFERTLLEVALADPDCTRESLRATCQRLLVSEAQQERLIESLLTLAQSQSGLAARGPIDLGEAARNALSSRTSQLAGAGLSIDTDISPALISGDGHLVDRLITNLLDNAIRYNVPAGSVSFRTWAEHGYSGLMVANSGPCITPEQVTRLQRPFERLGPVRTGTRDGAGLGLSIVASIARAHGAELSVEPRADGGLIVCVKFKQLTPSGAATAQGGLDAALA